MALCEYRLNWRLKQLYEHMILETTALSCDKRSQFHTSRHALMDYCNQGKADYSGHDRALGARYVRYKCANEPCMCALDLYNIIFLLEYSSVYSRIQRRE